MHCRRLGTKIPIGRRASSTLTSLFRWLDPPASHRTAPAVEFSDTGDDACFGRDTVGAVVLARPNAVRCYFS